MSRSLCAFVFAVVGFGADGLLAASETPAGKAPGACQEAVLMNGFTIQYTRREVEGAAIRLWLCAESGDDYIEIPSAQIERFEERQSAAVPLAPAAPPALDIPKAAAGDTPVANDQQIAHLIASAALRHQIDPDFVASVVKAESGFLPTAVSPRGAQGLMQLMPRTAAELGVRNALDPAENVEGGTTYLRRLLDRYDWDAVKALAAYNAGPQRVEQYGSAPPYPETRAYVARIINDYSRKKQADLSVVPGSR